MAEGRAPRRALMIKIGTNSQLTGADHAILRNISETGLSARMTCPCYVGEKVSFDIPGAGLVEGVVRWARQNSVGVEFDRKIILEDLTVAIPQAPSPPAKPIYAENLLRDTGNGRRPGLRTR